MDAITLENGKPVTRILAECIPNIVQVKLKWKHNWCYFPDQDLLPGWQWAPMDITTEMPELPFRRWNTSIPICGDSLFLFFLDVSTPSLILHLSDSLKLGSACKYAFYMLWGCLAFEFINIEWINTYCQNKSLGRTSRRPAEVKYANIELCRYFD